MTIVTCPDCGAKNRVDETRAEQLQPVCGKCGGKLPPPGASAATGAGAGVGAAAAAGHPVVVTDATLPEVIAQAGAKPVLVDAWAAWCGPCRAIAPIMDQLAAESGGRYVVGKLNVDENPRSAAQYRIEGIPTMLLFKNGKLVDKIVGLAPKQTIAAKLAQHV